MGSVALQLHTGRLRVHWLPKLRCTSWIHLHDPRYTFTINVTQDGLLLAGYTDSPVNEGGSIRRVTAAKFRVAYNDSAAAVNPNGSHSPTCSRLHRRLQRAAFNIKCASRRRQQ